MTKQKCLGINPGLSKPFLGDGYIYIYTLKYVYYMYYNILKYRIYINTYQSMRYTIIYLFCLGPGMDSPLSKARRSEKAAPKPIKMRRGDCWGFIPSWWLKQPIFCWDWYILYIYRSWEGGGQIYNNIYIYGGFLKWWVSPNNFHGVFLLKMISTWGVKWGYHHLKKHPVGGWVATHLKNTVLVKLDHFPKYLWT